MELNLYNQIYKLFDGNIRKLFNNVADGNIFYRITQNIPSIDNPMVIPQKRTRFTSNFGNYHTPIIDSYLAPRKLPLRSQCIMFETGSNYINENYEGHLACVIPQDKSTLCYVECEDLWGAFSRLHGTETFNKFTRIALKYFEFDTESTLNNIVLLYNKLLSISMKGREAFVCAIDAINHSCGYCERSQLAGSLFALFEGELFSIRTPADQWLQYDLFDLDNNIKYMNSGIFIDNFPNAEYEVWTDGVCLVIDSRDYVNFLIDYMSMST